MTKTSPTPIKRINDFLAGLPMTAVSGLSLLLSFIFPKIGVTLPADPAWVSVFVSGLPLVYLAVYRVLYNPGIRRISSALLIVIAMFAAIFIGDIFAAGEVAFIMALGAVLEDMTTNRAKKGLHKLLALAPAKARRIRDSREELIPAEQVQPGDCLRIFPGETIPVDGELLKGELSVDQSVMTGESLPVDKAPGDEVFCGTINCFGTADIFALRTGEDTSLKKLVRLVQEAEEKQSPIQRTADTFASFLVPAALLIAVLAGIFTKDIIRAVTVLVVFCPCALVLATPTAVMAAIAQATRHGIVIKSGEALERMGKSDTIAFDKTGTLTCGSLQVSDILPFHITEDELLSLTAAAESLSGHPLGKAVVHCAREKNLSLPVASSFSLSASRGISAVIGNCRIFCGNELYVEEMGLALPDWVRAEAAHLRAQGKAVIITAEKTSPATMLQDMEKGQTSVGTQDIEKAQSPVEAQAQTKDSCRCLGLIALSDTLRPEAKKALSRLQNLGVHTLLLTGDSEQTARYFAKQSGISEVHAQLMPDGKLKYLVQLQEEGHMVCMIGDGVNDAPALKAASVGIAMGAMGSDIAVEAADIALMQDDLAKLPYLKRLANAAIHTIQGSIALSMCINAVAVTASVMGLLTPTTGALVHNAGSCFVILIAALLYDRKFE